MFRLLVLLAAVTLSACSSAPAQDLVQTSAPPDDADAGEPAETYDEATMNPYHQAIRELRKTFDLYPWVEVLEQSVANAVAANTDYVVSFQRPYGLVVGEFTQHGFGCSAGAGAVIEVPFDATYKIVNADQGRRAAVTRALIGTPGSSWFGWGRGRRFEVQQSVSFALTTRLLTSKTTNRMYIVVRGYRLWPKGQNSTPQYTLQELAKRGFKPDSFVEAVRQTVPASTDEVAQQFTFQDDYLIRGISLSDGADSIFGTDYGTDTLVVRIDAEMPLFSGNATEFVSRYALTGSSERTAWWFPVPIRVAKNTVWTFRSKHLVAPAAATTLDWVLHGGRLHRTHQK